MLKLKASIVRRLILLALMNNESFEHDMKMLYDIGLIDPKTGQLTKLGHDASKTACDFFKTTVPSLHGILCLPLELERFTTIEFEHDWDDFNEKTADELEDLTLGLDEEFYETLQKAMEDVKNGNVVPFENAIHEFLEDSD